MMISCELAPVGLVTMYLQNTSSPTASRILHLSICGPGPLTRLRSIGHAVHSGQLLSLLLAPNVCVILHPYDSAHFSPVMSSRFG